MIPRRGHRAGMAILRVEVEVADASRVLLRITTIDDIGRRESAPEGEPFADPAEAIAYLQAWLERWIAEGVTGA
jgi:hypothetical protein